MKFEALRDKLVEAKRAADYRKELNLVHKMAVRRELQRQQEELKLDMDMIEKLNAEFAAEQQQMSDDKLRLKKELDTYLNYLKELRAQKAIDDCMVEALADADVARAQKILSTSLGLLYFLLVCLNPMQSRAMMERQRQIRKLEQVFGILLERA